MAFHPHSPHQNIAGIMSFQAVDAAQDGRLAGARRADDADDFTLLDRGGNALEHLNRTEALMNIAKLDHRRFARVSRCRTSRMSGMLMVRYMRATSVNTLVFLNVEEAISLPCSASSATVMVEACDESFKSIIMMLP